MTRVHYSRWRWF